MGWGRAGHGDRSEGRAIESMGAEELEWSEEAHRTLVDGLPALICRSLPDGTLTFVNQHYCATFGRSREELVGANFLHLIPEEEREGVCAHYSSLTPERPTITYEHQVPSPEGEVRWQRWTDRAVFDERGQPLEYQSVGEDITGYKRMERALRGSEREYRDLIERANDGIAIVQDAVVKYVNRRLGPRSGGKGRADPELEGLGVPEVHRLPAVSVCPVGGISGRLVALAWRRATAGTPQSPAM